MEAKKKRTLILILGSLMALGPLSIDMYLPAFSKVAADFNVPTSQVEWTLAAFFLGLCMGQLVYGFLADRLGRKLPLYFGLSIYLVASLGCALAPTIEMLVICRFLQALGACAGMVISRAMVRDLFSHHESAAVFSTLVLVMGVAPILAPLMGGEIIRHYHWSSIFWFLGFFSALCLTAVAYSLPESRKPNPEVLLRRAFHSYAGVLRHRDFFLNAISAGLAQAGLFAYITGSPYVFIELYHVAPENYGWIFGSNALGLIATSQLNVRFVKAYGPRRVLNVALLVTASAAAVLLCSSLLHLGLVGILVPLFFYVASLGAVFPNSTANALSNQGNRAGVASALIGTIQFLLATLAALLVSVLHSKSELPMTGAIAFFGFLAFLISRFIDKPEV